MRWAESFIALFVMWAIALAWCWIAAQRGSWALFVSWLFVCPVIGFQFGFARRRMPGLPWLGLGSIPLAFAALLVYRQVWDQCPSGEEGESCQIEQLVVWFAGLYALGVAAAIVVGVVVSTALQKIPPRQIS